jgi:hypothetical protein
MGSSLSATFWIETETFYFIFQTGKKEATGFGIVALLTSGGLL